jgi:probable HAF family extracellular repeat protein
LGTLGAASPGSGNISGSQANGINASGQVVGFYDLVGNSGTTHAFLYDTVHGMLDLNSLINPSSGWVLNTAQGINESGQISGTGTIGGQQHAFVLTIVPEPSSVVLAASGFVGLAAWGWRRWK